MAKKKSWGKKLWDTIRGSGDTASDKTDKMPKQKPKKKITRKKPAVKKRKSVKKKEVAKKKATPKKKMAAKKPKKKKYHDVRTAVAEDPDYKDQSGFGTVKREMTMEKLRDAKYKLIDQGRKAKKSGKESDKIKYGRMKDTYIRAAKKANTTKEFKTHSGRTTQSVKKKKEK